MRECNVVSNIFDAWIVDHTRSVADRKAEAQFEVLLDIADWQESVKLKNVVV